MENKTVLIIDDDVNLCQIVKFAFTRAGAQVYTALNGREGLREFYEHRPDLVLLDIRMPDMDGWETCRQIRLLSNIPIIMLTTMNQDGEIVQGLNHGADDFVTKPFSHEVLMARARAVLRRADAPTFGEQSTDYHDSYLAVDLKTRRVFVRGEPVKLTATEFRLLSYLLDNADRILTYEIILNNVWGEEYQQSIDYVHVYLSHLRRKLEEDPRRPRYLMTEHGVGYRFERHMK